MHAKFAEKYNEGLIVRILINPWKGVKMQNRRSCRKNAPHFAKRYERARAKDAKKSNLSAKIN
jgi:hypothetical protein